MTENHGVPSSILGAGTRINMYYLYILKSIIFDKYYVGVSDNTIRRLDEHNKGYNKSTRPYKPYKIIYLEKFQSKDLAMKKEWWIKNKPEGRWFKKEIIRNLK